MSGDLNEDAGLRCVIGPARLAFFTPITEQPILADRKATFTLAMAGLMITVLMFFLTSVIKLVHSPVMPLRVVSTVMLGALVVLLLLAVQWAYRAYVLAAELSGSSLAFYRDVGARSLEEYQAAMERIRHPDALRSVLMYNHALAVQAAGKYHHANRALRCMRWGIPIWMLMLIVIAVWG
jgi:hypothetical protein